MLDGTPGQLEHGSSNGWCWLKVPPAAVQGAKYKRRWVEVTADTMVYAATQQDALTGHIQVFAIGEMMAVRPEADTKFQVIWAHGST